MPKLLFRKGGEDFRRDCEILQNDRVQISTERCFNCRNKLLIDLNRQYPGLRFRVVDEQGRLRTHMKVFVNKEMVRDLSTRITSDDEVTLMQALSGG